VADTSGQGQFPAASFRARREAMGWSQERLSRELDVSLSTVRNWERGDGGPTYENLLKILKVMDWLPDELVSPPRMA